MEVYLLRHGIAQDDSPTGRDSDRPLTEEGRRKLRDVLKVLSSAGIKPETIVSSPYLRARQTAEIAQELLGYKDELVFTDALTPDSDPEAVWQELRTSHSGVKSIILASHEPLMSRCTGFFLRSPELLVDFKKGAVVRIDFDHFSLQPRGVLKWMLTAKLT
ncbi:MAG TPA: phosphohistidine phosphatase SixA [Bryobacteraceae bacterium]|nr:phosphohistidine phosphatase SixA [Bryobacteraceae bacterium]